MSLKAFHIAFIVLSAALAAGFAAWCFREVSASGNTAMGIAGGISAASSIALGAYGVRFLRKTKDLGYL